MITIVQLQVKQLAAWYHFPTQQANDSLYLPAKAQREAIFIFVLLLVRFFAITLENAF